MILILGATGMLGQALMEEAAKRGLHHAGASSINADFRQPDRLEDLIRKTRPSTVINCAAITNLARCETNPCEAYMVNAQAVARLAAIPGFRLIQISTDHFWTGDKRHAHAEHHKVRLVNEYARTKYAAERFALTAYDPLIVRTNIVGAKNMGWLIDGIQNGDSLTLYEDFITSPIDVRSLSRAVFDIPRERQGILNIAGREPVSKLEFGKLLCEALGFRGHGYKGSVRDLKPQRAESLGLNVERAEKILGRALPTPRDVAEALI